MGNCNSANNSSNRSLKKSTADSQSESNVTEELSLCQSLPTLHSGRPINFVDTVDCSHIVTCGENGGISITNWRQGTIESEWLKSTSVTRVVCGKVRKDCFSCTRDLVINQWRQGSQEPIQAFSGHELSINALAVSHDENRLCSGSRDYTVRIWDLEGGKQIAVSRINRNVVTCCQWFGDSEPALLAQGSEDLTVRLWDTRGPALRCNQTMSGFIYFPLSMDISQDGRYLLTGGKGFSTGNGADVKLWDFRSSAKPVYELSGHSLDVKGVSFLPNSVDINQGQPTIASVSKDQTIRLWDQNSGDQITEWNHGGGMFTSMSSSSSLSSQKFSSTSQDSEQDDFLLCAVTFWGSAYVYNTRGECVRQNHVANNPNE